MRPRPTRAALHVYVERTARWRSARAARSTRQGSGDRESTEAAARRRSPAGNVLFEKIGVLEARELDRETLVEMAHHAALRLTQGHHGSHRRPLLGRHGGARQ